MQEKVKILPLNFNKKKKNWHLQSKNLTKAEKELSALQTETAEIKSKLAKTDNERKDIENKLLAEKKDSSYWKAKLLNLILICR